MTKTRKIETDVLAVLARSTCQGSELKLPEQLDRDLYMRTNKVLLAAGGKWNRGAAAHVFEGDSAEAMDPIILTGEYVRPEDFGFFETPLPLVAEMIALAGIKAGMKILEPSCGTGRIVRAAIDAGALVYGNEFDEGRALKVDAILAEQGRRCMRMDFIQMEKMAAYDRVIMNPPFAKRADVRHILHALAFLKPGGRIVAIASASVMFREDKLATLFRSTIENDYVGTIRALPESSFEESGTHVNTCIIVATASELRR